MSLGNTKREDKYPFFKELMDTYDVETVKRAMSMHSDEFIETDGYKEGLWKSVNERVTMNLLRDGISLKFLQEFEGSHELSYYVFYCRKCGFDYDRGNARSAFKAFIDSKRRSTSMRNTSMEILVKMCETDEGMRKYIEGLSAYTFSPIDVLIGYVTGGTSKLTKEAACIEVLRKHGYGTSNLPKLLELIEVYSVKDIVKLVYYNKEVLEYIALLGDSPEIYEVLDDMVKDIRIKKLPEDLLISIVVKNME